MAAHSADLVVSTGLPARYAPAPALASPGLDDLPVRPACGTIVRSALLWTVAGVGFVMAWSALVPLQSAVVASAVVAVESSRKPVQSQTGGTIKRLLVKEGATGQRGHHATVWSVPTCSLCFASIASRSRSKSRTT